MVKGKVLIVDDDPNLIRSLEFVFRHEGFGFDTAINGQEAMAKIREDKPALVILDVMLPLRNGYEISQDIKNDPELRAIKVVLLSAKGHWKDIARGFDAGADEYITKPFSPKYVVSRVNEILSNRSQSP